MKLRDYQSKLVQDFYQKLSTGCRRIAIIAGTGAGKTIISTKITDDAVRSGKRVLFLVHLDVLVGQTYEKMKAFGLECGFIKAGWPENPDAPIQIASIQTMARRQWWKNLPVDLIIYDEAHISFFSQVGQEVFNHYPAAVHAPMTATPLRLQKEQLGDYMETLVSSPTPSELQRMGFLAPLKYYQFPNSQIQEVAEGSDFSQGDIKIACDKPQLIQQIVREWYRLVPGKRTIAFCVDVEHANNVAQAFRAAGVTAATVDGNTPIKDRNILYSELGRGELTVLTACNVISIGFDEPSVEVGLMLRPTNSSALHFQQIGRVMRISPETNKSYGYILDQANNLARLGYPEDIKGYALPFRKESGGGGGIAPIKSCPCCDRSVYLFTRDCPACNYHWESKNVSLVGPLIEVQVNGVASTLPLIQLFHGHRRRAFLDTKPPEVAEENFALQTNRQPEQSWCLGSLYGPSPSKSDRLNVFKYLTQFKRPKDWVITQFENEVGKGSFQKLIKKSPSPK